MAALIVFACKAFGLTALTAGHDGNQGSSGTTAYVQTWRFAYLGTSINEGDDIPPDIERYARLAW